MLPAGKVAKSAGSQPLVLARRSVRLMSTGTTGAVTSPGSDWGVGP